MNSVLNSDSKQCTESRLGWVHRVHTQLTLATRAQLPSRAHGAVLWRALGRIVALSRLCRRHILQCRCAHAHAVAQCRSSPRSRYKIVSQHKPLPHPHCEPCSVRYRGCRSFPGRVACTIGCIAACLVIQPSG